MNVVLERCRCRRYLNGFTIRTQRIRIHWKLYSVVLSVDTYSFSVAILPQYSWIHAAHRLGRAKCAWTMRVCSAGAKPTESIVWCVRRQQFNTLGNIVNWMKFRNGVHSCERVAQYVTKAHICLTTHTRHSIRRWIQLNFFCSFKFHSAIVSMHDKWV